MKLNAIVDFGPVSGMCGAGRGEDKNPRGGAKVKILLIYEQRGSSITIVLVSKCRYFSTMKENFTA